MNEYFGAEFDKMDEWARKVSRELGPNFDIIGKRETILDTYILMSSFTVETELSTQEVVDCVRRLGENYRRGRRHFFVFDKGRRLLFLLFYSYFLSDDRKRNS
jgi:hypothetical protein